MCSNKHETPLVFLMQVSFALSCGSVVASRCSYVLAIKPEAVFTLTCMHVYICIDVGIKLIFKIRTLF